MHLVMTCIIVTLANSARPPCGMSLEWWQVTRSLNPAPIFGRPTLIYHSINSRSVFFLFVATRRRRWIGRRPPKP